MSDFSIDSLIEDGKYQLEEILKEKESEKSEEGEKKRSYRKTGAMTS